MAHICMSAAWNQSSGIGVDIHVERISNRLGWHLPKTNVNGPNPELARSVALFFCIEASVES